MGNKKPDKVLEALYQVISIRVHIHALFGDRFSVTLVYPYTVTSMAYQSGDEDIITRQAIQSEVVTFFMWWSFYRTSVIS